MSCVAWKAALLPLLLEAALGFGAVDGPSAGSAEKASEVSKAASSSTAPTDFSVDLSSDADDTSLVTVPSGTLVRVEVTRRSRLREGNEVQARLLEAIFAENRLLVPSGAVLHGTIIETHPAAHNKRLNAKLHGDFTPLREPVIEWTTLARADGSEYSLDAESTTGTGGTLYFRTEAPQRVSFMRRAWGSVTNRRNKQVQSDEVPHKGERLQTYLWSQLPLHPQYLEQGARYEMRLNEDLTIAARPLPVAMDPSHPMPLLDSVWVYARLQTNIDSATAKPGDPVEAIVTQPAVDEQGRLVIPQNSVLHGKVLSAEPSRPRGHNGTVRFAFEQVTWPTGFAEQVEGMPAAVESSPAAKMEIDKEGGVALHNEHSIMAPLTLGLLSGSTLGDEEAGRGRVTASSNGFAIIGRVAGLTTGSPFVGGSIGAVATARSIYKHWLAHGKETYFGADTEVVLEMAPAHANPMSAEK